MTDLADKKCIPCEGGIQVLILRKYINTLKRLMVGMSIQ